MKRLWIDFETYCDLDIKKVGLYKYVNHPSFHPWCASYAINDEEVDLWVRGEVMPLALFNALAVKAVKIYAHNAEFEYEVLKTLGYELSLRRFVDTQALAGLFGYPLSLDKFCKAIGLPYSKDASGTRLINKLCKPQKKTIKNPSGRWFPDTAPEDFFRLYKYCMTDTDIMRKAVKRLPMQELPLLEQYIWGHTVMQNQRGIKIDIKTVNNIVAVLNEFKKRGEQQLSIATGGSVKTAKQLEKMKTFLSENRVNIPNLTKDTVDRYLKKDIPEVCKIVLELRKQLAHSSVAKFKKMQSMCCDNDKRIRGNLAYYAAHTGRFAGRGLQVHNLPRAQVKDPEKTIKIFNTRNYELISKTYPDINATASMLIRPMITAEIEKLLIVADYSSIENVILHWCAGDEKTLQDFRNGLCQYKVYSASRLDIPYDKVTKEQRQQSKPDVLGLGFGGGFRALIKVAAGYGVILSPQEAQERVKFYRNKYKLIPRFWRNVYRKAKEAVETKDPQVLITPNTKIQFRCAGGYLFIILPSGRRLSYPQVKLNAVWEIKVNGKQVPMTSDISYMGVKNKMWLRLGTHPGLMAENIIQALARDILVYGLLCAEQAEYKILMSVHDEGIAEGNIDCDVEEFCEYMCMKQKWAKTIPLKADGYVAKRYRKD